MFCIEAGGVLVTEKSFFVQEDYYFLLGEDKTESIQTKKKSLAQQFLKSVS